MQVSQRAPTIFKLLWIQISQQCIKLPYEDTTLIKKDFMIPL